jgi:hypothetical protein
MSHHPFFRSLLEKLLPDLEARPDLGHLAIEIKKQIDKISSRNPLFTRKRVTKIQRGPRPVVDDKSPLHSQPGSEGDCLFFNSQGCLWPIMAYLRRVFV